MLYSSGNKITTTTTDPCASRYSLNLAWASCPEIMHLLTPSMRSCLMGSKSCVPGGKLGVLRGQTSSALISAEVMASSTLRPMGGAGGRVMPPLPFGLGAYKSLVVRSNSCRA